MKTLGKILSATFVFFLSTSARAQVPRLIEVPIFPTNSVVTNSVITADFNGDGLPDIASTEQQYGNGLDVLLNNGDGTFQSPLTFDAGAGPTRPAAGDLDGDGKLDLIVPDFGLDLGRSDKLRVFLGNGNGTFRPGHVYHVGNLPNSAALGDFNGDGKLDVVVATGQLFPSEGKDNSRKKELAAQSGTVQVLLGNGDGTLQSPVPYPTAKRPVRVAVGDLNGDGVLDLVVATSARTVSVLLGAGDGTFQPHQDYQIASKANDMILADLNNDGKVDVAVAASTDVSVLLNNGDGTLAPAVTMPIDQPASNIVAGDLNEDGKIDLVVSNGLASVYFGNGDGTFQAPIHYLPGQNVAAVGQFDAKPGLDLVVDGASFTTRGLAFLSNSGDGTFFAPRAYPAPLSELTIVTKDLNGDGKSDLIATAGQPSNVNGSVSVYLNDGAGTFPDRVDYGVGEYPVAMVLADVNGDGKDDLAVANKLDKTVSILFGNGDGSFQAAHNYPTSTAAPQLIAAGDFNGDGAQDLVTSNFGTGTISILLSVNGSFPSHTDLPVATVPTTVIAEDFNGDGKADLAVSYTNSSQEINSGIVSVFISNGDGTFQPRVDYPLDPAFDLVLLTSGDVNGDGKKDLLAVRSVGPTALLLGNGDGTFQSPINSPSAQIYPYPFSAGIQLADIDGDGVLDLVLVQGVSVSFGNGDGTFQTPQYFASFGTLGLLNAVATADFNGDGALDVAVGEGNISILSNTGGSHLNLTSSKNPSHVGDRVTFASEVLPTFAVGTPTGTVTFLDGIQSLGTATLIAGKAGLTVSTLSAGKHFIQSHYNGDATFVPNQSKTKKQIVDP